MSGWEERVGGAEAPPRQEVMHLTVTGVAAAGKHAVRIPGMPAANAPSSGRSRAQGWSRRERTGGDSTPAPAAIHAADRWHPDV